MDLCGANTAIYNAEWWEKYVYLRSRTPLMINSNYYVLDSGRWNPSQVQVARAAVLLRGILRYKRMLEDEQIEPITLANGTVPLCMWQFERMFSTTRIPGRESDRIVHWDPDESRHVAILCEGSFYRLPVYTRVRSVSQIGRKKPLRSCFLSLIVPCCLGVVLALRLHSCDSTILVTCACIRSRGAFPAQPSLSGSWRISKTTPSHGQRRARSISSRR